tara:strand:- start:273 stop:419 length:147 start_codon:yes stop_codon:yes gene_type:complete
LNPLVPGEPLAGKTFSFVTAKCPCEFINTLCVADAEPLFATAKVKFVG